MFYPTFKLTFGFMSFGFVVLNSTRNILVGSNEVIEIETSTQNGGEIKK